MCVGICVGVCVGVCNKGGSRPPVRGDRLLLLLLLLVLMALLLVLTQIPLLVLVLVPPPQSERLCARRALTSGATGLLDGDSRLLPHAHTLLL